MAKLYKDSEKQLKSDLRFLQINDDVIEKVLDYLKAPIATSIAKSSSMIEQLLDNPEDSKQTEEKTVKSRDIICADLLPLIQEYIHSPSNQENDEKENNSFKHS